MSTRLRLVNKNIRVNKLKLHTSQLDAWNLRPVRDSGTLLRDKYGHDKEFLVCLQL